MKKTEATPPLKAVYVQNWEESERGWGTRPDGFTVHPTRDQRDEYVRWFNETFNNESEVPDEYTRADGEPFPVPVEQALYDKIVAYVKLNKVLHGKPRYWDPKKTLTEGDLGL